MGIEIVHHQTNFFHMRIMLINKFSDKIRPINLCPLCCDFRISLTYSWFKSDKDVCCSIALILWIIPQWLARESGERSTNFPNQLGRHFIHTYLRILRIIRFFIDISDFFHVTDNGGILLWRHTPFFLLPRLKFVFFMSVGRSHGTPLRSYPAPPSYPRACVRSTAHVPQELDYNIRQSNALLRLR
jgi:hypothetical protein